MKVVFFLLCNLIVLVSCKNENQKPIWENQKEIISVSDSNFQFESKARGWEVSLQNFIQPIPVKVVERKNGFSVEIESKNGIIEGPADLVLKKNNQVYSYSFYLSNKPNEATRKYDYRSPKTVNPDSILVHQSIFFNIDKSRNIKKIHEIGAYFSEHQISLPPKVMVQEAILNEPITSYYVQAGSATQIPIKGTFDSYHQQYRIFAGPIYDQYQNLVADGTLIRFEYEMTNQNGLAEVGCKDGYAQLLLPKSKAKNLIIKALIHDLASNRILITEK